MARIAFPLGFKITDNAGAANTGQAIDERLVFADLTARTAYVDNFLYEGLLSYTIAEPYHVSGVTSDAGFYYRDSADAWVGINADTIDDKHAYGTMDSTSNAESDPTTGTNIVDHVNYLYTLTDALSTSRNWLEAVTNYADLATTYPTPSTGDSSLVTSEASIYTYNGATWVKTGSNVPSLSSTVSGIVNYTWYNDLSDFVTNTSNYLNGNAFRSVSAYNNSSLVGSYTAVNTSDSFELNGGSNVTLSISGKRITISSTDTTTSISAGEDAILLYRGSNIVGVPALSFDDYRLTIEDSNNNIRIGANSGSTSITGTYNIAIGTNSDTVTNTGDHNLVLGNLAGLNTLTSSSSDMLIISTANTGLTAERNLIYGEFPATEVSNSYGYLKLRGSLYIKETDCSIDRIINGGDTDLTFTDPHAGTYTLSELIGSGTSYTIGSGLTDNAGTINLGGAVVDQTVLSLSGGATISMTGASANFEFSDDMIAIATGNDGMIINGLTQYTAIKALVEDTELTHKKYVDDRIDQWPFDEYRYFRQVIDTDTEGDVRIYCNLTGYYIQRYESAVWNIKSELLW